MVPCLDPGSLIWVIPVEGPVDLHNDLYPGGRVARTRLTHQGHDVFLAGHRRTADTRDYVAGMELAVSGSAGQDTTYDGAALYAQLLRLSWRQGLNRNADEGLFLAFDQGLRSGGGSSAGGGWTERDGLGGSAAVGGRSGPVLTVELKANPTATDVTAAARAIKMPVISLFIGGSFEVFSHYNEQDCVRLVSSESV